jgi:hypothetical protein
VSIAATPPCPIDARAAILARQYNAKGDLELMFVRQIASAETTFNSLQRALDHLYSAPELDCRKIDTLTRAQARAQRMAAVALKDLRDLQDRRNLIERFPEQTKDRPPLASHVSFVGETPFIRPYTPPQPRSVYPIAPLGAKPTSPNPTQIDPYGGANSQAAQR